MPNPTRVLVLLLLLALGGVSTLAFMAHRYARIVERRGGTEAARQADRRVVAFIAVRQSMGQALRAATDAAAVPAELERARSRALAVWRLSFETYHSLRSDFRAWRAGTAVASSPTTRAFERRRAELLASDLGPYESLEP